MNSRLLAAGLLATALTAPVKAAPQTLVMEKVTVRDPMVNDMVAGTLLKPKGWKFDGGMKWYPDAWHQVCFEGKVTDPDSLTQLEFLPWCACVWFTKPVFPLQPMTNYMGSVVLKPMAPSEVIEKITIPDSRKGLNVRVVGHHDMPEIAKFFAKIAGTNVKATRSRIEYTVGRQTVHEDIYLILSYSSFDIGGGNISTIWGPVVPPFAIRAAKEDLDAVTPAMLASVHSGWLNPKWADEVGYVKSLFMKRMRLGIEDAGKLSKQISANNDYIIGLMREARAAKNASEDRVFGNFSDYIRGVQPYAAPGGGSVQLPSGYGNAWAGSDGTYLLSNEPNFDPNKTGRITWTAIKPVDR
ncbi:hypothetical protein [Zavarzinella formosa]|uniref:hypothetical protein n=1 Tax=Zavarzinella formosa TaxID=360055 RepID=UPI0003172237|nr:hypothetical protein [Zavarzinella formosa]